MGAKMGREFGDKFGETQKQVEQNISSKRSTEFLCDGDWTGDFLLPRFWTEYSWPVAIT